MWIDILEGDCDNGYNRNKIVAIELKVSFLRVLFYILRSITGAATTATLRRAYGLCQLYRAAGLGRIHDDLLK